MYSSLRVTQVGLLGYIHNCVIRNLLTLLKQFSLEVEKVKRKIIIKYTYQTLLFPEYVFGGVIFYIEHKYLHKLEFLYFCLSSSICITIIRLVVIFWPGDRFCLKPKFHILS